MFNSALPFATVHGHEYARYFQNGKHYNAREEEIDVETGEVNETPDPEPPVLRTEPEEEIPDDGPVDLDNAHWKVLKEMVTNAGGQYVNKKQAVAFLRGI